SPSNQAGASGSGQLYLNTNEDVELNLFLPLARDQHSDSGDIENLGAALAIIPDFFANADFLGLGPSSKVFGGSTLSEVTKLQGSVMRPMATFNQDQAGIASRTASYQHRAYEYFLQYRLAAHELMQIGRQILSSLIAEQITYHDYRTVKNQVTQAQDIQ